MGPRTASLAGAKIVGLPAVLLALVLGAGCGGSGADLVLRGGAVYTVDAARSWAQAVAVDDGRIVFVGEDASVEPWIGPGTEVIDLAGRMLLPGFHDSHVHPDLGSFLGTLCQLDACASKEALLDTIEACAGESGEAWLLGYGWQNEVFFPDVDPRKEDLDQRFPDRPVALISKDMHTFWVNSEALERAGLTAATPDPPGGTIERNPHTGEPSGTLRDKAVELVLTDDVLPGTIRSLRLMHGLLERMNEYGYTSLMDARLADPDVATGYWILEKLGQLDLRVSMALLLDPTGDETQIERFIELRSDYTTDRLRASIVKIFLDGNTDAGLAFLLDDYEGADHAGQPYFDPETLKRYAKRLDAAGFAIHVHVIGDGAARLALDAIEAARRASPRSNNRHTLTHLELTHPDDWPRFAELGVIANISPWWAFGFEAVAGHPTYAEEIRSEVGPGRAKRNMAFRSLLEAGATISAGSDYPFTPLDPFDAIEAGITRRPPEEPTRPPYLPEQRLDLETLLAAYTIQAAYQLNLEASTGSIEVGKAADLIVVDRNLFAIPVHEISETQVLLTLLDGEAVFRAKGL